MYTLSNISNTPIYFQASDSPMDEDENSDTEVEEEVEEEYGKRRRVSNRQ